MDSDFVAALPVSGQANKTLLRAALVKRVIYPFYPNENPATWVANVGGSIPAAVATSSGGIFFYDSTDAVSPPDGVTVVRSQDNYCYKTSNMTMPDEVLALGVNAPTGAESIGAAYITSDAPSGIFAGNPSQIAVLTIRGWLFIVPRLGRPIYVRGDRHYYKNEAGLWLPTWAPLNGGVRDADIVGGNLYRAVENSITNTPPVSPPPGTYWRIGGSPTGAWAGHANKIATWYLGASAWTIIAPIGGMLIYDKADKTTYVYDSGQWVSQRGAIVFHDYRFTVSGSETTGGSGNYTSGTPTTAMAHREDSITITHTARAAGAKLRFSYEYTVQTGNSSGLPALFRDNEGAAVAWGGRQVDTVTNSRTFIVEALNAAPHVYKMRIVAISGVAAALERRLFQIEEFA